MPIGNVPRDDAPAHGLVHRRRARAVALASSSTTKRAEVVGVGLASAGRRGRRRRTSASAIRVPGIAARIGGGGSGNVQEEADALSAAQLAQFGRPAGSGGSRESRSRRPASGRASSLLREEAVHAPVAGEKAGAESRRGRAGSGTRARAPGSSSRCSRCRDRRCARSSVTSLHGTRALRRATCLRARRAAVGHDLSAPAEPEAAALPKARHPTRPRDRQPRPCADRPSRFETTTRRPGKLHGNAPAASDVAVRVEQRRRTEPGAELRRVSASR